MFTLAGKGGDRKGLERNVCHHRAPQKAMSSGEQMGSSILHAGRPLGTSALLSRVEETGLNCKMR